MKRILLGVLALAAMGTSCKDSTCDSGDTAGCTDDTTVDDSSVSCFDAPPAINIASATYNCDNDGWWYDVYAVGLLGSAELYIYQTGSNDPWWEFGHEFDATQPFSGAPDSDTRGFWDDVDGCWDNPYLELAHVESYTDVVAGSTTLYDCTTERENTLTWSVVVYDTVGAAADCGSWGDDPTGTYEDYNFGGCDQL